MENKIELTSEELAKIMEQNVGVVELSDEMLQMVAGGQAPYKTLLGYFGC
jgi:hypothetical protein